MKTLCATPPAPLDAARAAPAALHEDAVRSRLQQLFRHTLQGGLINPLLHITLRHRLETHS